MNASQSAEINEFLSQMNNCGQDGVFVIATTNRPDKIDSAILRSGRIDYKIYVPAPDFESRKAIFSLALKGRPCEDNIDFDSFARNTEGFLASDITSFVQTAAREAFRNKCLINSTLTINALQTIRPSMTKAQLSDYERMKDKFESDNPDKKRSAGFF